MANIVYFDLETQKIATEVGGWGHIDKMGLAVAVLYHTDKNEYSVYLEKFLTTKEFSQEVPEIEMYLADVKRELGKAKEASELYKKVIDTKDARYSKEAATLWTASLSDAISKQSKPGGTNATQPSSVERDFVAAADELEENLEGSAEAREASL